MKIVGSELYISTATLTGYGVPRNTVDDATRRNRKGVLKSWQHIYIDSEPYVKFKSIPPATKVKLPSESELVAMAKAHDLAQQLAQEDTARLTLMEAHKTYINPADFGYFRMERGVPDDMKCTEMVEAAAWLRLLMKVNGARACQKLGFESKKNLRQAVLKILKDTPLEGLKVTNYRILQRKESDFAKALKSSEKHALDTLVSKNYGNNRAQKRDRIHESILIALYANPDSPVKFRKIETYVRYVETCIKHQIPPLSESSVKAFLKSPKVEVIVAKARHGGKHYDDNYRPYTPRLAPQYSNTHWSGDGTVADLYYRTDKGVRTMISYWIWVDWTTKAVVGFDIAQQENRYMVRNSIRMALKLNGRHMPMEIQTDNSTAAKEEQNMKLFAKIAPYVSFAKPGNAKEKPVERVFNDINEYFRQYPNWKGNNIQSKSIDSKANPDLLPGVELPDLQGVKYQIVQAVNAYNNEVQKSGKTRIQEYHSKINKECKQLDDLTFTYMFDNYTAVKVNRGFFKVEVNSEVHEYEVKDIQNKLDILNQRVRVYFDEEQMHTVHIFKITDINDPDKDQYLESVTKLKRVRGAKAEQTEEDGKLLGYYKRKAEEVDNKIDTEIAEALDLLTAEGIVANPFSDFKSRYKDELNTAEAIMFDNYFKEQERAAGRSVPVQREVAKIDLYDDGEEGQLID